MARLRTGILRAATVGGIAAAGWFGLVALSAPASADTGSLVGTVASPVAGAAAQATAPVAAAVGGVAAPVTASVGRAVSPATSAAGARRPA